MGIASPALVGERALTRPTRRVDSFPRARFRMAAILSILMTVAAFGMVRDEAPLDAGGTLLASDGSPIVGASVEMLSGARQEAAAISDGRGRWWLSGGHRIDSHQFVVSAAGFLPARVVPGRAAVVTLHAYPALLGAVVDDAGAAVAGATLSLVRPHDPTRWSRISAADGSFTVNQSLPPGEFQLSVSAADHDPFRSVLHLQADGRTTIQPVLVRQLGSVAITSSPAGLVPLLDGKPMAACTTPCALDLLVGKHSVAFQTALYVPWSQVLDVHNKDRLTLSAVLERKQGTLAVSAPPGELSIDGTPVTGNRWTGKLPTGTHLVTYTSDSAWPYARSVIVAWEQTTTIAIGADQTAIVPGDQAAFLAGMGAYLKTVGGQYGVYLKDLKSGLELGSGQDEVMEAASDIKVPLALFLLNQVEAGKLNLTDMVTLQDSDFMSGTGTLDGTANSGDKYSVQDLLSLMITISDNTAWQALQRVLTPEATDAYVASIGAPDCHQLDDNCTAHELGILFDGIYHAKLLQPAENKLLLDLLSNTIFNERIPYYLGSTVVAHKTGADGGVMNDAGIVYLGSTPFIVSVFTVTDDGQTGIQATRDIARAFAHFLTPVPK